MKKFYEVIAKCGHVGRGNYVEGVFYVRAFSGSDAATQVRMMPRVKHDHKDAIISVREISRKDFDFGQRQKNQNPYYSCANVQEQRACFGSIEGLIKKEPTDEVDVLERALNRQARIRRNNIRNKIQQKYAAMEIACAC